MKDDHSDRLVLQRDHWYAMTMLPGYSEGYDPFNAPVRIDRVEPLRTGRSELLLYFLNFGYAEGVQDFVKKLQVVDRHRRYIVFRGVDEGRHYIFGTLSARWLGMMVSEGFVQELGRHDLQGGLTARFGRSLR